jgi:hypothetical protein
MGDFLESNPNVEWPEYVPLIEREDPVIGGVGGIANNPHQALADRTEYLRTQVTLLDDEITRVSGGSTVPDLTARVAELEDYVYKLKLEVSIIQNGGGEVPPGYEAVLADLTKLMAHISATTGVHGAVYAATANKLAIRNATGQLQVGNPIVDADAATKYYVDALELENSSMFKNRKLITTSQSVADPSGGKAKVFRITVIGGAALAAKTGPGALSAAGGTKVITYNQIAWPVNVTIGAADNNKLSAGGDGVAAGGGSTSFGDYVTAAGGSCAYNGASISVNGNVANSVVPGGGESTVNSPYYFEGCGSARDSYASRFNLGNYGSVIEPSNKSTITISATAYPGVCLIEW